MRKVFRFLIIASLFIFCVTGSAGAEGFYMGFLGGGSFLSDAKASDPAGSSNFSFDGGFDGSVTLGYDLGTEYPKIGTGRVECELNTASNDIDEVEFIGSTSAGSGKVERTSVMLNTIGEYKTQKGIIIYALLGLGWAEVSLDNVSVLGSLYVDDTDSTLLAYQAGLGLGWKFSPHLFFDISYRYYGTTDPEFTSQAGDSLEYEYNSHRLLAGVRVHF